jgi:hypothetical protein
MKLTDAIHGGRFAGEVLFEEVFGLIPELFKIRPRRQRLRHITFLLSPVVRRQAASRLWLHRH